MKLGNTQWSVTGLEDVDWNTVALRATAILVLWLVMWLLQHYLIRWSKAAGRRLGAVELREKDRAAFERLVNLVLLIVGLGITLYILDLVPLFWVSTVGWRVIAVLLLWTVVWVLVRYLSEWIMALDEKTEGIDIDPRDLKTVDRLLDSIIIVIGIIATLAILDLTPLLYSALTAAGVFGIALGFAVQDVASNVISGVLILMDRPFVVGDSITVKGISGTVNRISLRSTDIITYDGPIVTVPNSTIAQEAITNYTLSQHRRVRFTVSVLSTADLNLVVKTVQNVLEAENRLLADKPPSILVDQIRDSAVDLQVTAYTAKEELVSVQSDLQKEIVSAFTSQGIELAVPLRMNLTAVLSGQDTGQSE